MQVGLVTAHLPIPAKAFLAKFYSNIYLQVYGKNGNEILITYVIADIIRLIKHIETIKEKLNFSPSCTCQSEYLTFY